MGPRPGPGLYQKPQGPRAGVAWQTLGPRLQQREVHSELGGKPGRQDGVCRTPHSWVSREQAVGSPRKSLNKWHEAPGQ